VVGHDGLHGLGRWVPVPDHRSIFVWSGRGWDVSGNFAHLCSLVARANARERVRSRCDDGSFGYINQNGKIATYLSQEDNVILAKFLKKRFGIKCTVNKDGNRFHLYFSVEEIKKFLNLIKEYVPKCMNYKLGPLVEDNMKRLTKENRNYIGSLRSNIQRLINDLPNYDLEK